MKTKISLLIAAIALAFGCSKDDEVYPTQPAPEEEENTASEAEFSQVAINPETGEPEAINFDEVDFFNMEDKKESDFSNASIGGQIFHEFDVNQGSEPNHSLEVFHNLPPGYVITGIGLRIYNGTVTTMVIEQRFLKSDGTFGPRYRTYHGRDPYHSLEVWYALPTGYVVTGVGVRVHDDNVTTMRVYSQYVDPNSPDNQIRLASRVYESRVGTAPNNALEIDFDMRDLNTGIFTNRAVFTGIGFRCRDNLMTTMKAQVGYLQD